MSDQENGSSLSSEDEKLTDEQELGSSEDDVTIEGNEDEREERRGLRDVTELNEENT